MEFKDYYKTLGVEKGASEEAIKGAYKKLAVKYHPDKNPGDKAAEAKFKEINEAKEVLTDPEKRRQYDELGADYQRYQSAGGGAGGFDWSRFRQGGQGGPGGGEWRFDFGGGEGAEGDFSDFFETLFGRRGGATAGTRRRGRGAGGAPGADLRAEMDMDLEEAYRGAERVFEINGQNLRLRLKPGIRDGQTIKLAGKGQPGLRGGPPGDLYITLHVNPKPGLERKDDDLHQDLVVDAYTATLGGKAELRTLKGAVKVDIAPGTDSGKVLRLKGMGMPVYDRPGAFGDWYARIQITTPKDLDPEEKDLFRRLAEKRAGTSARAPK